MRYEITEAREENRFIILDVYNVDIFGEHFNHKEAIKTLANYIRNRNFDIIIETFESFAPGIAIEKFEALSQRQKNNFIEYYIYCGVPYEVDREECIKTIHENFKI